MGKEDRAYQEWLAETTSKLPEDVREHFKAITETDAGKEVFRGSLRREDYDRRVSELSKEREQLNTWFEAEKPKNEKLVAELATKEERLTGYERLLKDAGLLDGGPGAPPVHASIVKKEDLEEVERKIEQKVVEKMNFFDRALPAFLKDISETMYTGLKEGYNVSPSEVIDYATENKLSARDAFNELTAQERRQRETAQREKEREEWKAAGAKEALSKLHNPAQIRPAGPTVLDVLRDTKTPLSQADRVNAAVKDFLEGDFKDNGRLV